MIPQLECICFIFAPLHSLVPKTASGRCLAQNEWMNSWVDGWMDEYSQGNPLGSPLGGWRKLQKEGDTWTGSWSRSLLGRQSVGGYGRRHYMQIFINLEVTGRGVIESKGGQEWSCGTGGWGRLWTGVKVTPREWIFPSKDVCR